MACIAMVADKDPMDVFTGGRQIVCANYAKQLCEHFKELGAELVFFIDGPIKKCKIPHHIENSNQKYLNQQNIFEYIRNEEKPKIFSPSHKMSVYINNFLTTIRSYSKISISFANECDLDIANYATQCKALAVVTCDTDFLIFPGNWQVWISILFNRDQFTIFAWNKMNLLKNLNLRKNHMPIFSTLSGNDFVKYEYVQYLHKSEDKEKPKQKYLAEYILKEFPRGVPLTKDQFNKLAKLVYNYGNNNITLQKAKEIVSCSLNSYNYDKREKPNVEIWLKQYIQSTNSIVPYMILKDFILTINQSWMDMSLTEFKPYSELVIPIVRRQMGILLDHKREKYPERDICFKPSHEEPYQIKKFSPIYYENGTVPNLEDLLRSSNCTSGDCDSENMENTVTEEEKFSLLCWVSSTKNEILATEQLLKFRDSPFLLPMMCGNYLVKEAQITIEEADILLISINEAMNSSMEKLLSLKPPEIVKSRHVWISLVYNRLLEIFRSSLAVCGLYRYSKISYFDGYIFHKMMQKYPILSEDIKQRELERIKNYRIYVS
ncbi:uncharacterized protein LOC129618361 isoform X2 [Condylostylus longicornis]|nr:uncharacterized protein LOC129618361 isoform X2 [Condylostylus longicornis]